MSLRDLSPWDMAPYLALPKMVTPVLVSGSAVQVLTADPMRMLVSFSATITCAVGTDRTVKTGLNLLTGWALTSSTMPLVLTAWDHGPIVCGEWWCFNASSTGGMSLITQSLLRWPQPGLNGSHNAIIGAAQPRLPPNRIDATPGVGGKRNILDYWLSLISRFTGGR